MRGVANRAQVSVRTVSRVINSQGEITEATRQRVLATIDEMDFRPSKLARGLVSRHTDTIGLIVGDIANPFFSEIARATQDTARAAGYDVFFCNSGGSWEEELRALHSLADHGVDGIVISPILARDLLVSCRDSTAIGAHHDLLALGAMRTCRELGRRIPGDYAIIGFADIPQPIGLAFP
jgi:DNA-binding LacI/PurR family transcriptional regulator